MSWESFTFFFFLLFVWLGSNDGERVPPGVNQAAMPNLNTSPYPPNMASSLKPSPVFPGLQLPTQQNLPGLSFLPGSNEDPLKHLVASVPPELEIRDSKVEHGPGVFARNAVGRSARFGPFLGRWVPHPQDPKFAWEVSRRFFLLAFMIHGLINSCHDDLWEKRES
jgi:hypothetical protein